MSQNLIIKELNELIEKSNRGDIPWTTMNANANRWISTIDSRTYTTTIQKQPIRQGNITVNNFILTIQATNPNEVILQLNTQIEITFKELLEKLFTSANLASKKNSADVLRKLMSNL